ncbi:MAG: hypothetical protein HFF17_08215 [Oscillospiraceae bacterium]|nr:hypothetical protein [Oscillospiraceae bacterium]
MGASRSKRERRSAQSLPDQPAPRRSRWIAVTAVVLVLALLAAGITLMATGFLAAHVTAASVAGHELTGAMFSYFYRDAYNTFASQNPMAAQTIDPTLPFDQQVYNQEQNMTWADYFLDEAAKTAADTLRVYDAAMAAGFTLSETSEQTLESNRTSLESIASLMPSYADGDAYIRASYGRGCDVDSYLEYARIRTIANDFAEQYRADLSYSAETIQATYAANPQDFDTVSYKIFYSSVVVGKNDDGTVQADMDASRANAERMAEECRGDIDRFNEMTVELAAESKKSTYSDPNFSLREDTTVSSANEILRDWLADPARQYGDTVCLQADERGYYVGFFIDYKDNSFPLASLRAIAFRAYASEDNPDDPDGMKAALARGQEAFDTFEAGARTAEAFDALAEGKTSYDPVYAPYLPGDLDGAVDDWCYDQERSPADYALLRGSTGYYLVWFDGYDGGSYRDHLVDEQLRSADYDAWYESVASGEPARLHATGVLFMSK